MGELLWRYLTDEEAGRRERALIEVRTNEAEIVALDRVQRWLRAVIGRRGLVVESNPSSNLLIGEAAGFVDHPAVVLTRGAEGAPVIEVSVNSDDPLTFATSLPAEFARLYAHQWAAHGSVDHALSWIAKLQRAGWLSRFTTAGSKDPKLLARALL